MKIGYQGEIGSNSEEAAHQFATKHHFEECEFIPLVNSKNVVNALNEGSIDYGTVAIRNSIIGMVIETYEALKREAISIIDKNTLSITNNKIESSTEFGLIQKK